VSDSVCVRDSVCVSHSVSVLVLSSPSLHSNNMYPSLALFLFGMYSADAFDSADDIVVLTLL
jgi:hypothetical protein